MKNYIPFLILLFSPLFMCSQALSEFKWQNRLLVIFTESENSQTLEKQMKIFEKQAEDLEDRKLMVIHSIPGKHHSIFPNSTDWKNSSLYEKKENKDADYEIILIGLDGGVKLRQNELLKTKKLFALIDSMPMRQAEMRRNQN